VSRLFRILLNALTVLSLILCVAMVALWVRSARVADCIGWDFSDATPGYKLIGIVSTRGAVSFSRADIFHGEEPPGFYWNSPAPALPHTDAPGWRTFGIESRVDAEERATGFLLPHWLLALMTAMLPAVRGFFFVRQRSRTMLNLCGACGYDLRATPDRCPECGTIPAR